MPILKLLGHSQMTIHPPDVREDFLWHAWLKEDILDLVSRDEPIAVSVCLCKQSVVLDFFIGGDYPGGGLSNRHVDLG